MRWLSSHRVHRSHHDRRRRSPELEGIIMRPVMRQATPFVVRVGAHFAGMLGPALVLPVMAVPLSAQQLTPREIATRARPAVVLVTALRGGEEIGMGSGFLVSDD